MQAEAAVPLPCTALVRRVFTRVHVATGGLGGAEIVLEKDLLSLGTCALMSREQPMNSPVLFPDHDNVKLVHSFEELVATPFSGSVNALCWQRTLPGDFAEVVRELRAGEGITTLDDAELEALPVSAQGRVAIGVLLEDLRLLRARDLDPVLDCINGYLRDETPGPIATDVYSF
ncbi:MAG: hypothetical protein ACOYMN_24590, partial [Roseimicrobium sp.]